jgi:predicted  nucleic acid-binding Zn-ribbon protein
MSYLVGRWFNEFLSYRQELAKEELEKLRIQTVLLKRRQDNSTDPREIDSLQKQLDYYNNRINKLQGKLDSMVEE